MTKRHALSLIRIVLFIPAVLCSINASGDMEKLLISCNLIGCTITRPVLQGDHKITEGMEIAPSHTTTYTIDYSDQYNAIILQGVLDFGVVKAMRQALIAHPSATGVILESEGGNIYQARGLAQIILTQSLDTYTFKHCFSACTIVYIAGKKRSLGADAILGFHGYRVKPVAPGLSNSVEREQAIDRAFFDSRIRHTEFTDKIYHLSFPDIWIPDLSQLQRFGVVHQVIPQ